MTGVSEVFESMAPVAKAKRGPPAVPASQPVMLPPKRFALLTGDDLAAMPHIRWAVRGLIPESGVGAIFGASTAGKSFLSLDLVAALAEGRDWFGHRIAAARRVISVVLEGAAGFRLRVAAWVRHNGRPFPASVRFVFQPFAIAELSEVVTLVAAIDDDAPVDDLGGRPIIVIDTLNRSAPGADENSSRDMGLILEGANTLQSLTDGFILLVHHSGKDATKGMRGHSSLFAALDVAIEVTRTDDRREWKVTKAKDGEDGQAHPFRLEIVDLGEDEEGEPITSCVVQPDLATTSSDRPRPPKGGNQRIVFDALGPVFRESAAFGKAGAPAQRPCVRLEDAVTHAKDRLTVPTERRTERTRQALTGLVSSGVMGCNEGWIWLK